MTEEEKQIEEEILGWFVDYDLFWLFLYLWCLFDVTPASSSSPSLALLGLKGARQNSRPGSVEGDRCQLASHPTTTNQPLMEFSYNAAK